MACPGLIAASANFQLRTDEPHQGIEVQFIVHNRTSESAPLPTGEVPLSAQTFFGGAVELVSRAQCACVLSDGLVT